MKFKRRVSLVANGEIEVEVDMQKLKEEFEEDLAINPDLDWDYDEYLTGAVEDAIFDAIYNSWPLMHIEDIEID